MESGKREGPLSLVVLEEIALDGLEGLSIEGLWMRLSPVLGIDLPFLENFQNQIWNFIKKSQNLFEFYELPQNREKLKNFCRTDYLDPEVGEVVLPDECPFTRYKYNPIEDGEIRGSCEFYRERKKISFEEVKDMSLDEVLGRWGDSFIIVAVQHIREHFLVPETLQIRREFTVQQYCVLEMIGRSRYNGEVTCGKHSLLYFFKESNLLFYVTNKLIECKFIMRQLYYESATNRNYSGHLLTLPKYFSDRKPKSMAMIEEIFKLLKTRDHGFISNIEAKDFIKAKNTKVFKRLRGHLAFKKCFEVAKVPYRLLYPGAEKAEYMQKNGEKEKEILGFKLKDHNMELHNIWMEDEPGDEELEFATQTEYCLDAPLINQIFQYIEQCGTQGVTQKDLLNVFGLNRYIGRGVLNKFVDDGICKIIMEDFGRQRTRVFVSQKYVNLRSELLAQADKEQSKPVSGLNENSELEQNDVVENSISENLENSFEEDLEGSISTPKKEAQGIENEGDLQLIEAVIKNLPQSMIKTASDWANKLTQKQIRRKNLIISAITEKKLIDLSHLLKTIKEAESKKGYKEEVCRKSLGRLLSFLMSEKNFNGYEIILKKGSYARVLKYFTLPTILPSDKIFQDEIKKCKTAMHLAILDKKHRQRLIAKQILEPKQNNDENLTKYLPISRDGPKTPKFLRAQYYHEYFVYLAYDLKRNSQPIAVTDNIIQKWKEYDPTLDIDELLSDLPKLYSDDISWKMFISPLTDDEDIPLGWITFKDVVDRLPLSLITKANWIKRSAGSILEKYLSHPIRQHYVIQSIPEVATYLFENNVNINQIDDVIRLLGNMGLIQVMEKTFKELKKSWIYVNKCGKVLDTRSSDPGYNKICPNKEYPEQLHYFESVQNASDYWRNLQKIVLNTKLGFKNTHENQKIFLLRKTFKEIKVVLTLKEALKCDVGYLPGDNMGAGGLDTRLYSHLQRNWSWQLDKKPQYPRRDIIKPNHDRFGKIKKLLGKDVKQKKKVRLTLIAGKKVLLRRHVSSSSKNQKIREEYDEIDKEALKRMKSLRVTWTAEEDRLLKICRSVFLYLNDSFAIRSIQFSTVRDILQWAIASLNKTAKACHRRLRFMTKYKRDVPDTAAWLHDLKQNQYVAKIYGRTFLNDLRKIYPVDREYAAAIKIHYIKLVSYLIKILNPSKSTQNEIILPDTLNQFNMLYNCCSTPVHDYQLKHYEPKTSEEIEISTINGLIHSSVCCMKDKTLYNIQLFEIYKEYNENILAKAFSKVRKDYLVVATKAKDAPNKSQKLLSVGPSLILSGKYRQQLFIRIPYSCVDELHRTYVTYLHRNFAENQLYDYTSVDSGTCLFLSELYTRMDNSVDIQLPQRILTVDPHQEKCKVSEKILEHFRRLFENGPKTEYSKRFEEKFKVGSSPQTKITFNVINESCKIPYNPFEILIKLSDDYIHFFCILNSLNNEVCMDFQQLKDSSYCPFDCVLRDVDYIISIEKIIAEKKEVIEGLTENHDFDEEMEEKVVITEENIMSIYFKLRNMIRTQSKIMQQRDMGKISCQPQTIDIILLAKEVLNYSDQDFISIDGEYMPTLSKEDKIIKAQDIFVVNLPRVKINHFGDTCEKVKYKDMMVPINLMCPEYNKEEIINKIMREYIMSNTSSTVDDLIEDMLAERFSNIEQSFTKEVLKFIEQYKFGVSGENLLNKFEDEVMLKKSVSILRKHSLIMRVGVEHFVYVHKSQIQPWVVNTYHIKRLEKESLKPNEYRDVSSKMENENADEPASKKKKLETIDEKTDKRSNTEKSASVKTTHKQREKIIMRPCPWMRVNASLNRRVLDKWLGTILLECVTLNGLDILKLCVRFNMLHPVNIMFLLEILRDIGCIELKSKKVKNPTLLSTYQDPIIGDANEFTRKEDAFILVTPNALTRLSLFIGDKKYKTDFV